MDGTVEMSQVLEVADLGALIRGYRKSRGVTQVNAAREAGVGPRFMGELENGKATVQLGTVLQVLASLGMGLYVEVPEEEDSEEVSEG
jgi:HTH-type transcriptional regulator / antitoxin HipB